MNQNNTNYLKEKYKKIYDKHFFGFSIDNGWFKIIDELLEKIQSYNIKIIDIKEKFGGLRVYTTPYDEEAQEIINYYESLSYDTCERCGNVGESRPTGWIRTLCDRCYASKYFQYKSCYKYWNTRYVICG